MKPYNYKYIDLIIKTIFPVMIVWTVIMIFGFYLPYKKRGIKMPIWVFVPLGIPYIWALDGLFRINKDTKGQGLVVDRPSCLNIDVPESLQKKGFVGLYKPECRGAQQKIGYTESASANKYFNYLLNILFLLILIFISMKLKRGSGLNYRMQKSATILVFILLLGSLVTSGFIVFPWRAIVFTRIGLGFIVCAASLLTFMIVALTSHFYPIGKNLVKFK